MNADKIAHALGDARREGRGWRCRCPLHGGRSLVVKDGSEQLLVTCWAGCHSLDVLAELRRRGLLEGTGRRRLLSSAPIIPREESSHAARIARALAIWCEAQPMDGTIAETYLRNRGIDLKPWPVTLRFHPRCPRPRDDAGKIVLPLPAMVGLVEHVERGPVAIHMTYLSNDGTGKAVTKPRKAFLGPVGAGAVRIGNVRSGEWLLIGEGIETSASAAVACGMPAWAALSAGGIKRLALPSEATQVIICADNDANGVGQRAANEAAERFLAEGRRVRVVTPPNPDSDFNDMLIGGPNW